MADEPVQAESIPSGKGGRGKLVPILIIAVVMVLEGVGVFALTKLLSPPPPEALADGSATGTDPSLVAEQFAEIEVASCRPTNKQGAKISTVSIRVVILVAKEHEERVKELVEKMKGRIHDRVNAVVRRADARQLNEPELDTIKRQLKNEFDLMFEDDKLVEEVVIPELLQSR